MNIKTRKTGARLWAVLLSLCLMMGLLPATASAEQEEPIRAIQLVDGSTPNITGYDATTKTYDYIYYGTWEGSPIKWRVLDNATNTGEAGLFLLTDVAHIEKGNGLRFDVTKPDDPGMSIWETSDARSFIPTIFRRWSKSPCLPPPRAMRNSWQGSTTTGLRPRITSLTAIRCSSCLLRRPATQSMDLLTITRVEPTRRCQLFGELIALLFVAVKRAAFGTDLGGCVMIFRMVVTLRLALSITGAA